MLIKNKKLKIKMKTISNIIKVSPLQKVRGGETSNFMLKNESFSFQILIKSNKHLRDLYISLESCLSENIKLYGQKNVTVYPMQNMSCPCDKYQIKSKQFLYPDILEAYKNENIVLYKDINTVLSAEIYDFQGVKPGIYPIKIFLKNAKGDNLSVCTYNLKVLDAATENHDLVVTNWLHYDCLSEYYGIEVFSARYYEMLESYIANYIENGNNMILVPLFTPALDTEKNYERATVQLVDVSVCESGYEFDFRRLDFFIKFMLARGIKYLELSHFATQWGAEFCPKIVARKDEKTVKIFGWENKSTSLEYFDFLSAFLPELNKFLTKNNYGDRCYIHISDEPKAVHMQSYMAIKKHIGTYLPGYKFMDAVMSREYAKNIDIPVVSINHTEEFIKNNDKIFIYYCSSNALDNASNRFIHHHLLRTRIIGYQLYLNNVSGFLQWGYNYYYSFLSKKLINPFVTNDAEGRFPAGDAFIVYPGVDRKPISSLRQAAFRQALYDYTVLRRLEQTIGKDKVKGLLKKYKMAGFKKYSKSSKKFLKLRRKIYGLIK